MDTRTIVVLEGDQTGQELLEASLRVLQPDVVGLRAGAAALRPLPREPPNDVERRRARGSARDRRPRSRAQGRHGDPGRARRCRLAEPHPPRGHRRQGDRAHRPADPRRASRRRGAFADLRRADGRGRRVRREGMARGRRRRRGRVPYRAHRAEDLPCSRGVRLPAGRAHRRKGLRRAEVHGQPDLRGNAEGGDGRGGRAPSRGAVRAAADRRDVRPPDLVEWRTDGDSGA